MTSIASSTSKRFSNPRINRNLLDVESRRPVSLCAPELQRPTHFDRTPVYIHYMIPQTLLTVFLTFLKSGGLTIGDGYATVAPLRRSIVKRNGWMSDEDFSAHLAMVHAMPGIFNVNLATYMGHQLAGWKGSAMALLGMLFPPLCIIIVFATFFNQFREFPAVASFLQGARPAIVAIIALPCVQMWRKSGISLSTVWIPVGAAIAVGLLGVSPTYIILALVLLAILYAVLVHVTD